jgi:hypothetical protein
MLMRDDEEIAERIDQDKARYDADMAARRAEVTRPSATRQSSHPDVVWLPTPGLSCGPSCAGG